MPEFGNSVIIGGGLAGLAAAWWAARQDPARRVIVLEKEAAPAGWLARLHGGPLVLGGTVPAAESSYPRGWEQAARALAQWPGAANREWVESLGIETSAGERGAWLARDSAAVAPALDRALAQAGVVVRCNFAVESIVRQPGGGFRIWSREGEQAEGARLLLATGGERNHGLKLARELGAEIIQPAAGFVRLRLASPKLGDRLGPMRRPVRLRCLRTGLQAAGEIEISSRGLEGPAVSELGARTGDLWRQLEYRLTLEVDWLPEHSGAAVRNQLGARALHGGRRMVGDEPLFGFGERQWQVFLDGARVEPDTPWARLKDKKVQALVHRLKADQITVDGMGLPAGERAWAGGVDGAGVDAASGESLAAPGLYYAGEILDILGLPGGPHLDAAWATAYRAGSAMGAAR